MTLVKAILIPRSGPKLSCRRRRVVGRCVGWKLCIDNFFKKFGEQRIPLERNKVKWRFSAHARARGLLIDALDSVAFLPVKLE